MRCARLVVPWLLWLLLSAHERPALAQGPGWILGDPDDCQRREIAAEPQQHRFWTDAAPVTLYQYAYLQPEPAAAADPAGDPPRRRIQLQKRRVDARQLWQMDQQIPAFDFSYSLVRGCACCLSAHQMRACCCTKACDPLHAAQNMLADWSGAMHNTLVAQS